MYYTMETPKFDFFPKKFEIQILIFDDPKSRKHLSFVYQSYISNWYINGKIFRSTSYSMETQKFEFISKMSEIQIMTCDNELK